MRNFLSFAALPRHGRICSGHPRLASLIEKTWMAVTSTAMTIAVGLALADEVIE
jgi:hypothetical protein